MKYPVLANVGTKNMNQSTFGIQSYVMCDRAVECEINSASRQQPQTKVASAIVANASRDPIFFASVPWSTSIALLFLLVSFFFSLFYYFIMRQFQMILIMYLIAYNKQIIRVH